MKFAIIEKYPINAKVKIFSNKEDAFSTGSKPTEESEVLEGLEQCLEWISRREIKDENIRIIPSANNNPQGELE